MALDYLNVKEFVTHTGAVYDDLDLSFEIIGQPLHTAPIVLVNHALTGNSDVASEERGWWKDVIGSGKVIALEQYTVITINIPGNGYDGLVIDAYADFNCRDIAKLFLHVLDSLDVSKLYAIIGSSLGGGITWEMLSLRRSMADYIIPITSDWKATDWVLGMCGIQEDLLHNSSQPLEDARKMAMLFYRTPQSLNLRFQRSRREDDSMFNINSWLNHHGNKLAGRFTKPAYLMMNHLLSTLDISQGYDGFEEAVAGTDTTVIQVAVNSDILFTKDEIWDTKERLDRAGVKNAYHEITSIHGHDAFLIEYDQLEAILAPIFQNIKITI